MGKRKRQSVLSVESLEDRKLLDASYHITWPVANVSDEHIVTSPTLQSINFSVTNPDAMDGLFGVADSKNVAEGEAAGSTPGGIVIPAHSTVNFTDASIAGVSFQSFWVAGSNGLNADVVVDDTPAPVQQATTIVWANPADITYGTPLSTTQLNATAHAIGLVGDVPGTFTYTPPAGTVLHAGAAQVLSVQFTPTDLVNYAPSSGTALINVLKATPTITWNEPADITAGTPLSAAQLNAVGSVAGTFVYSPPAGTVLPVGQDQPIQTTFTPSNTADYNTATKTVLIDVNQQNVPNPPQLPQPPWWGWNPGWNWWNVQPPVRPSVHLFNEAFYLQHNPDVAAAVSRNEFPSGYDHFLRFGLNEGRMGTPDWTPSIEETYLSHNLDVAHAVTLGQFHSGYQHFVEFGQFEGRTGTPIVIPQSVVHLFDETVYLARYPDVAHAVQLGQFASGYQHFLEFGVFEGRSGSPDWTSSIEATYLSDNPDVSHAVSLGQFHSGYEHFFLYGQHENRPGAPLVA